jgi:hypothetical protein
MLGGLQFVFKKKCSPGPRVSHVNFLKIPCSLGMSKSRYLTNTGIDLFCPNSAIEWHFYFQENEWHVLQNALVRGQILQSINACKVAETGFKILYIPNSFGLRNQETLSILQNI